MIKNNFIKIYEVLDLLIVTDLSFTNVYFDLLNFNCFKILFFELNKFLENYVFNIFNYFSIVLILLIFFLLLKNLFLYSLQYYLIQLLFSFKYNTRYS